jgi:hypothetical protein
MQGNAPTLKTTGAESMHSYDHDTGHHDTGHHDTGHHDTGHHDTGHHDTGHSNLIINALQHMIDVQREGVIPYWIHHSHDSHPQDPAQSDTFGNSENVGSEIGSGEAHYAHFNPIVSNPGIIGNPTYDMSMWHHQQQNDTCAIAAQEALLDHFGLHYSEATLQQQALEQGWYRPHGGTPMARVGDLLTYHGLPVVRHEGGTISELFQTLNQHHPAIVAVNAEDIWYHGTANDPLRSYPGIPGQQSHHVVEVIGLKVDDLQHPLVILNDSGIPDGQGIEIPLSVFEQAWATSHHFIMKVADPPHYPQNVPSKLELPDEPVEDAEYTNSWADWNAKNADYKSDWADWYATSEAYKDS